MVGKQVQMLHAVQGAGKMSVKVCGPEKEVLSALRAIPGVKKVFILDGRVPHAILIETLTNEGIGTMFIKE